MHVLEVIIANKALWLPLAIAIAIFVVNTLANRMTDHPEVESLLMFIRDRLAVLQRNGSEGSAWKLPLKASKPPRMGTGHTPPPGKLPPVAMAFAFFGVGLALPTLHGCCTLRGTCSKPVADIVECGSAAIKDHAAALLPAVRDILYDGASGWEQKLELLAASAGADAVACAVHALVRDLDRQAQENPGKFQSSLGNVLAHERSEQYLASRGKVYR